MLEFVADTAERAGLEDYRLAVHVGPRAGQTVFHLHWHILVRHEPDRPHRGRAERGDAGARG